MTSRTRWPSTITALVLAFGGVISRPPVAEATPVYNFTNVADLSAFGGIGGPSFNSSGAVAFIASDANGRGVFAVGGAGVTVITQGAGLGPEGSPSLNDSGVVAFEAGPRGGGDAILTGNGGPLTRVADNISSNFTGFASPVINAAGAVAFVAGFGGSQGVFRAQGGTFTDIADNTSRFDGFVNNRVSINAAGMVGFYATFPRQSAGVTGVFAGDGGPLTTVADTSGSFAAFRDGPSIDDLGTVAFFASLKTGGDALYVGNGGPLQVIADTSGPFSGLGALSINGSGAVIFIAGLKTGGAGIFTGPDASADRVLSDGDPLFGSTVTSFLIGTGSLNDAEQIAFVATLADGREVLVRAVPTPEPNSFMLWSATGALALLGSAWRKGKRTP